MQRIKPWLDLKRRKENIICWYSSFNLGKLYIFGIQTQGYDWAHPIIHHICDLLEHVKEPDLQTQSCRIATTQGSSWKTPSGGPTLIV